MVVALLALALAALLAAVVSDIQQTLRWLAAAIFLALALAPAVGLVERVNVAGHHVPRWLAIVVVFVLGLIGLGLLVLHVIPPLIDEVGKFGTQAPAYVKEFESWASGSEAFRELNQQFDLTSTLNKQAAELPSKLGGAAHELEALSVGLLRNLVGVITIVVLVLFLLLEGRQVLDRMLGSLRADHAARGERIADRIYEVVKAYVTVNLALSLAAGLFTWGVLSLLGIDIAESLAILVAFFNLAPLIGLTIGGLLVAIVIAFADFPHDLIIWVVVFLIYQQLQDRVVQPMLYGHAVQVSPLIAILALFAGAQILGILGALIAIPVVASLGAIWGELRGAYAATDPAQGEPPSESELSAP
jgi:predicted PurR-regulated permease PerM